MPSVRIVVLVAGADCWNPDGALETVNGLFTARFVPSARFL